MVWVTPQWKSGVTGAKFAAQSSQCPTITFCNGQTLELYKMNKESLGGLFLKKVSFSQRVVNLGRITCQRIFEDGVTYIEALMSV